MPYPLTQFPTNLDNPTNPIATDDTSTFDHAGLHTFENNAIKALEVKVGKDSSAVVTSFDYRITQLESVSTADASAVAKGVTKLSLAPVLATNPIAVGDNDTRIPTVGQGLALSGSQGVASATNKFVTQDSVYTADTDQTQTTENTFTETGQASTSTHKNKLAQSFIPTKTKIRGVKLYKTADTGAFAGTVTVTLQADTAGSPSGAVLATQTITNANWILIPAAEFEVTFSAEYTSMVQGNLYWIVIETSTADSSNHPNLGTNSAGGYASGSVKFYNAADGWTAIATIDLYFKTLQGVIGQIDFIPAIPTIQTFTTPGANTYTKPEGVKYIVVEVVGGGGGGGGTTTAYRTAGGGGGGGYSKKLIVSSSIPKTIALTVGAGGTAGVDTGGTGGTGGTSSFGSTPLIQATGGVGGTDFAATSGGGAGGIGTLGDLNIKGGGGGTTLASTDVVSGGGIGGSSFYGGGAPSLNASTHRTGADGGVYGGGGGGATSLDGNDVPGGVGAQGIVIVTEYYY